MRCPFSQCKITRIFTESFVHKIIGIAFPGKQRTSQRLCCKGIRKRRCYIRGSKGLAIFIQFGKNGTSVNRLEFGIASSNDLIKFIFFTIRCCIFYKKLSIGINGNCSSIFRFDCSLYIIICICYGIGRRLGCQIERAARLNFQCALLYFQYAICTYIQYTCIFDRSTRSTYLQCTIIDIQGISFRCI